MRPFLRFLLWIEVRKHPFFDLRTVGNPEAVVVDFHLRAGQNFILFKGKLCARQQIAQLLRR